MLDRDRKPSRSVLGGLLQQVSLQVGPTSGCTPHLERFSGTVSLAQKSFEDAIANGRRWTPVARQIKACQPGALCIIGRQQPVPPAARLSSDQVIDKTFCAAARRP